MSTLLCRSRPTQLKRYITNSILAGSYKEFLVTDDRNNGVNLAWNLEGSWTRVKKFRFSRLISEKFRFFQAILQTKNQFFRANFRKISVFLQVISQKISIFQVTFLKNFNFLGNSPKYFDSLGNFRKSSIFSGNFTKKIDFSGHI